MSIADHIHALVERARPLAKRTARFGFCALLGSIAGYILQDFGAPAEAAWFGAGAFAMMLLWELDKLLK
jgi:hypothetical protein